MVGCSKRSVKGSERAMMLPTVRSIGTTSAGSGEERCSTSKGSKPASARICAFGSCAVRYARTHAVSIVTSIASSAARYE